MFKAWVTFFRISWKSKLGVKKSIFEHSKFVLSLVYQDFNFALKSPRTVIVKESFSAI